MENLDFWITFRLPYEYLGVDSEEETNEKSLAKEGKIYDVDSDTMASRFEYPDRKLSEDVCAPHFPTTERKQTDTRPF